MKRTFTAASLLFLAFVAAPVLFISCSAFRHGGTRIFYLTGAAGIP